MICPHCKENVTYRERGGKKCSKCRREFAFEPKTHPLGLHDVRFNKAIAKISAGDKLYFTPGQLHHFLSRKKIKNSFHTIRGTIIFLSVFSVIALFVLSSITKATIFAVLAVMLIVIAVVTLIIIWSNEGSLNLPAVDVEKDVVSQWFSTYGKKLPLLISNQSLAPQSGVIEKVRGVLVCPEQEILTCLAANHAAENLGLVLLNPNHLTASEKSKLDFIQKRPDLPVFVLHDASAKGGLLKDEFLRQHLGNDRSRKVFDIGLTPKMTMNTKLMRLRNKPETESVKNLRGYAPDETAWLAQGNYTPLLALTPAQLINFVTRAVKRRYALGKQSNEVKEAQSFGFMTWVGQ